MEQRRIKRLALQYELDNGDILHMYCTDPSMTLTIDRHIEYDQIDNYRTYVANTETSITIAGLKSYRITMGMNVPEPGELEA